MRSRLSAALLLLLCAAAPASDGSGKREAPSRTEDRLPAGARMLLLERMGNHRFDAARLHESVLLLDHERTKEVATQIAAEPRLAPPTQGAAEELNSLVPPRFFELQDELAQRARALASAASKGDAEGVARAYGAVTETCVRCHAVYLEARP